MATAATATATALCVDPVTGEQLEDAYLASDGETYSRTSLETCITCDVWKRSPVTREVLREYAYPNLFVDRVLNVSRFGVSLLPLKLYTFAETALPTSGRQITWSLSGYLNAADTMVRRRFGIADGPFTVTATLLRDDAGNDWLMHPPCIEDMRNDVLALAKLVGAYRMVCNPWCLTWAVLHTGSTIETCWLTQHNNA